MQISGTDNLPWSIKIHYSQFRNSEVAIKGIISKLADLE